jgi:hypothetical protein
MKVSIKHPGGHVSYGVVNQNDLLSLLESFKDKPLNVLITQQAIADDIIEAIDPISGNTFEDKSHD